MVRNLANRLSSFLAKAESRQVTSENVLKRCSYCDYLLEKDSDYIDYRVCPSCAHHYPVGARERVLMVSDLNTFKETNKSIVYSARSISGNKRPPNTSVTGLTEAAVTGNAEIGGVTAMLVSLDYRFSGEMMGGIVGEKIALAFEAAAKKKIPLIAFVSTGGSDIERGLLSLMQMAKVSVAVEAFNRKGLPFVCVMTNPTTGQIYSSFASLADLVFGEKGAVLGLAPDEKYEEKSKNVKTSLPNSAESFFDSGMIDRVVDRRSLNELLSLSLNLISNRYNTATVNIKNKHLLVEKTWASKGHQHLEELWPSDWEDVHLSAYNQRPTSFDLIKRMFDVFIELHGDRLYGDDPAVVAGLGALGGYPVVVIGQEKGHDITSNERHEGRTDPEGFRKAQRMIELASRLGLTLISFVDSPGPNYGLDSEARGLGNAIALTMRSMIQARTPTISVVISEGGSEGALAFAMGDRIIMLENAYYLINSPEKAKEIFRQKNYFRDEDSDAISLTAEDCKELGIIDRLITEPSGGANRNPEKAANLLKDSLIEELESIQGLTIKRILRERQSKFRQMGEYSSYFRIALNREASNLQAYVTDRIRLVRERRELRKTLRKKK